MPKLIFDHADIGQPYELEYDSGDVSHHAAVVASLEADGWVARPVDSDGEPADKPTPKSQLKSAQADATKEN